tara:strand:- start:395 stop:931 length:537 start_codon:yes stop_codon:yes gene_type:complete
MQPYEKLKKAYSIQVAENQAFVQENFNIASKLVNDLTAFLALPTIAETPDMPSILQFLRPKPEGGFAPVTKLEEAVLSFPEGKFQFGLGLLLKADGKVPSKQIATFAYNCDRTGDQMTIFVLGQSFDLNFTTTDLLDFRPISIFVFEELLEGLNWRISDEVEKTRVGFDVTPVDAETA